MERTSSDSSENLVPPIVSMGSHTEEDMTPGSSDAPLAVTSPQVIGTSHVAAENIGGNLKGNINSYVLPIFASLFIIFGTANISGSIAVGVKLFFTASPLLNTPLQNQILFAALIIQGVASYIFSILSIVGAVYNGKMGSKNRELNRELIDKYGQLRQELEEKDSKIHEQIQDNAEKEGLKFKNKDLQNRISELQRKMEIKTKSLNEQVRETKEKLEDALKKVAELREENDTVKTVTTRQIAKKNEEIDELQKNIIDLKNQLEQVKEELKEVINSNEINYKAAQGYKKCYDKAHNEVKKLRTQVERLIEIGTNQFTSMFGSTTKSFEEESTLEASQIQGLVGHFKKLKTSIDDSLLNLEQSFLECKRLDATFIKEEPEFDDDSIPTDSLDDLPHPLSSDREEITESEREQDEKTLAFLQGTTHQLKKDQEQYLERQKQLKRLREQLDQPGFQDDDPTSFERTCNTRTLPRNQKKIDEMRQRKAYLQSQIAQLTEKSPNEMTGTQLEESKNLLTQYQQLKEKESQVPPPQDSSVPLPPETPSTSEQSAEEEGE